MLTSIDDAAAPSPCEVISSETLFAALTSLSTTTTCAPSAARRLQIAAPMPLPPPEWRHLELTHLLQGLMRRCRTAGTQLPSEKRALEGLAEEGGHAPSGTCDDRYGAFEALRCGIRHRGRGREQLLLAR